MADTLLISDLAARTGFTPSALRYYERVGLLEAAERSPNGYRQFAPEAVDRLRFIDRARQLGLPLQEIRELVGVWDAGRCEHVQASLRAQVTAKSAEVQERVDELTAFSAQLDRALLDLTAPASEGACDAGCGCVEARQDDAQHLSEQRGTTAAVPERQRLTRITEVPVACTLEVEEQPGRLEEWEDVLGQVVGRAPLSDGIRLIFPPSPDLAATLASLALREQACCSFFTFTLRLGATSLELDATAPGDAQGIVQDLFGGRP